MNNKYKVKIFQIGVTPNGGLITEDAFNKAFEEGLFNNIPVLLYNDSKKRYGKLDETDEIIGMVKNISHVEGNDVIGDVVLFKDYELDFEFKNYEVDAIKYDRKAKIINEFTPTGVYIS